MVEKYCKIEGGLGIKNSEFVERRLGDAFVVRYIVRWVLKG